jgi:hypothetical protein
MREFSFSPNKTYLKDGHKSKKYQPKNILNEKLQTEITYNKYKNNKKMNPLKPVGNKRIPNLRNNRNSLKIKLGSKTLNQNRLGEVDCIKLLHQRIKKSSLNKPIINKQKDISLGKDKFKTIKNSSNDNLDSVSSRLNSKFNKNNYNNNNINKNKYKKYINTSNNNATICTTSSRKEIDYNQINIFDLSCLCFSSNINEFNQNLEKKLKGHGFNVVNNKINKIKCSYKKKKFEVNIMKMNKNDNLENGGIFLYKINYGNNELGINKTFSKLLFN